MTIVNKEFPKDFLWGSSISAYQAEGAVLEDGKLLSVADLSTRKEGCCDNSISSDFYHHYKEDIQMLKEMGAKAFRFSLSWPRILPDGEHVNPAGIQFYHKVLDELEQSGIEPIATLYHYDLPLALHMRYGGWKSRKTILAFQIFTKCCFQEFGTRIKKFLTINEPDILFMYGGHGLDLDGTEEFKRNKLIMNHHFALAHAQAVQLCHEMIPNAMIGPVFGYVPVYPKTSNPRDVMAAKDLCDVQNTFFQELFLNGRYMERIVMQYEKDGIALPDIREGDMELLKNSKSDFVALNYYKSDTAAYCTPDTPPADFCRPGYYQVCINESLQRTAWGWDIDPIGIRYMLRDVYDRYHLPLIIAENGMAAYEEVKENRIDDTYRIEYLSRHLIQCRQAIQEGVELIGYCNWSFLDLLSTGHGFEKRYGLVYIDQNNESSGSLKRIAKQSYYWYQNLIRCNGGNL